MHGWDVSMAMRAANVETYIVAEKPAQVKLVVLAAYLRRGRSRSIFSQLGRPDQARLGSQTA